MLRKKQRTPAQRAMLRFKQKQPLGIGKTRRQLKADVDRVERTVKEIVRAHCVVRDGYCRYGRDLNNFGKCQGPSEWSHASDHKRSQTRGQAPERRHTTKTSCMQCRKHHRMYERGTLRGDLGDNGFNGDVQWHEVHSRRWGMR